MFYQFSSLLALALLADPGMSQIYQHVLDTSVSAEVECLPQQVTIHAPKDKDDDRHFYHQGGQIKLSESKGPTIWTLERDRNYKDGWRIFWTHPNGNKQYWYAQGDEIRIGAFYSATVVYIRHTEKSTTEKPEVVLWWNDKCLNYGLENQVWMTDGSLCEHAILKNATIPEWKSSTDDCKDE